MTEKTDAGSSPAAENTTSQVVDTTPVVEATPQVEQKQADATTANGEKPESLLDAVKAAIKPEEKAPPAEAKEPEQKSDSDPAKSEETKAGEEEDDSKLPFHQHPRWKDQITKRRNAEAKATEFEQKFMAAEAEAKHYRAIREYMDINHLTPEEANEGWEIMAMMKRDPAQAFKMLQPHLQKLQSFTGDILPADVQRMVDEGEMTPEIAKQFAASRNQAALTQQHRQAESEQYQRSLQMQQQQQFAVQIESAVNGWEAQRRKTDPDFQAKSDMIRDFMRLEATQNPPRSVDEAVAIADRAYAKVNDAVKRFRPVQPTPKSPSSLQSQAGVTPAPATMLEAAKRALQRG